VTTGRGRGAWAQRILEQGDLYAPELLRVESANVLRRLERGKEITEQEANAAFEELMELNVERHAFEPFLARVRELRHDRTSYDGWHVALAEALNSPLAILDTRLLKAEGAQCRFLRPDSDN
jgi:predicted nucleic acid-binding protein